MSVGITDANGNLITIAGGAGAVVVDGSADGTHPVPAANFLRVTDTMWYYNAGTTTAMIQVASGAITTDPLPVNFHRVGDGGDAALNIGGLDEITTRDNADSLVVLDNTDSTNKRITVANFITGLSGGGVAGGDARNISSVFTLPVVDNMMQDIVVTYTLHIAEESVTVVWEGNTLVDPTDPMEMRVAMGPTTVGTHSLSARLTATQATEIVNNANANNGPFLRVVRNGVATDFPIELQQEQEMVFGTNDRVSFVRGGQSPAQQTFTRTGIAGAILLGNSELSLRIVDSTRFTIGSTRTTNENFVVLIGDYVRFNRATSTSTDGVFNITPVGGQFFEGVVDSAPTVTDGVTTFTFTPIFISDDLVGPSGDTNNFSSYDFLITNIQDELRILSREQVLGSSASRFANLHNSWLNNDVVNADRDRWFTLMMGSVRTTTTVTVGGVDNIERTEVVPNSAGSEGSIITRYLYREVNINNAGTVFAQPGGLLWSTSTTPDADNSFNIKTS